MKVQYFTEYDISAISDRPEYKNLETVLCDSDKVFGYNRVIAVVDITKNSERFYIFERFDGKRFIITSYQDMIKLYQKEDTLFGDIVNIEIHNKKEGTDKVKILDHHCIPLKKYCPTITGITKYIEHEYYTSTERNTAFKIFYKPFCVNHDTVFNIKSNTSLEDINNMRSKLKLLGVPNILVDINTVAILNNGGKEVILYTAQPNIFATYLYQRVHFVDIRRNYERKDIPRSQFDKYMYRYW
jgi:hypothetical protein